MNFITTTRKFLKTAGLGETAVQRIGGCLFTGYGLIRGDQWLKQNQTPSRFVILTAGRSGSTSLCDFLDSHDSIKCQSELLILKRRRPLKFLGGMASYYLKRGMSWGFKVKLSQITKTNGLDAHEFFQELIQCNFRLIYLRREDVVRSAISGMLGHQRGGRYHDANLNPVRLDPKGCVWNVQRAIKNEEAERELVEKFDHLKVSFEKHIATSEKSELKRLVCDYLDLEESEMRTSFGAVNPGSIWDQIENSDEIRNTLAALSVSIDGC